MINSSHLRGRAGREKIENESNSVVLRDHPSRTDFHPPSDQPSGMIFLLKFPTAPPCLQIPRPYFPRGGKRGCRGVCCAPLTCFHRSLPAHLIFAAERGRNRPRIVLSADLVNRDEYLTNVRIFFFPSLHIGHELFTGSVIINHADVLSSDRGGRGGRPRISRSDVIASGNIGGNARRWDYVIDRALRDGGLLFWMHAPAPRRSASLARPGATFLHPLFGSSTRK